VGIEDYVVKVYAGNAAELVGVYSVVKFNSGYGCFDRGRTDEYRLEEAIKRYGDLEKDTFTRKNGRVDYLGIRLGEVKNMNNAVAYLIKISDDKKLNKSGYR